MKTVISSASRTTDAVSGDRLLNNSIQAAGGAPTGDVTFQFEADSDFSIDLEGRMPGMEWSSLGDFDQDEDDLQTFKASARMEYRVRWVSGAAVTVYLG